MGSPSNIAADEVEAICLHPVELVYVGVSIRVAWLVCNSAATNCSLAMMAAISSKAQETSLTSIAFTIYSMVQVRNVYVASGFS